MQEDAIAEDVRTKRGASTCGLMPEGSAATLSADCSREHSPSCGGRHFGDVSKDEMPMHRSNHAFRLSNMKLLLLLFPALLAHHLHVRIFLHHE